MNQAVGRPRTITQEEFVDYLEFMLKKAAEFGLGKEQVAKEIRVRRDSLEKYLSGKSMPRVTYATDICSRVRKVVANKIQESRLEACAG